MARVSVSAAGPAAYTGTADGHARRRRPGTLTHNRDRTPHVHARSDHVRFYPVRFYPVRFHPVRPKPLRFLPARFESIRTAWPAIRIRRTAMTSTAPDYDSDPKAHPGLHLIAAVEAIKGLLALSAASGLELLGPAPLQRWIEELIKRFHLDPEHGSLAWLAQAISPHSVHLAAGVVLAYGLLHLLEAWGLWKAKAWASWLGCIGAALYLPFDLYALYRHPGWLAIAVLIINVIVVWVLGRDLFKRRH